MRELQSFTLNMALFSRYVWLYLSVVCESTIYSRKLIFWEIRNKTIGFTMTPKRNSYVHFAFGYTRLKMYGKGTKINEIREKTTIDTYFNISRLNEAIAFKFSELV